MQTTDHLHDCVGGVPPAEVWIAQKAGTLAV
jgi:hypothetical protein